MRLNWFLLSAAVTLLASCNAASAVDGFDQTKLSKSVFSSTDAVEKGTRLLRGAADTVNDGGDESDEERGLTDFVQKPQLTKWWLEGKTLAQAKQTTKNDHFLRNYFKQSHLPYEGSNDHKKFLNYEILLKSRALKKQQFGDMKALKLKLTNEKVSKTKMKQELQQLNLKQQREASAYKLRLKKQLEETMKKGANEA